MGQMHKRVAIGIWLCWPAGMAVAGEGGAKADGAMLLLGMLAVLLAGGLLLCRRQAAGCHRTATAAVPQDERFLRVFEAMPDALILSRRSDGRMLEVNPGFTQLTGLSRERVLGRTSLELGLWPEPADRRRLLAELARSGQVQHLVLPFRGSNDRVLQCEFNTRSLQVEGEDCLLSVVRDTSESELQQQRLRQAAAVLESTTEAVMVFDERQRLQAVSRAFASITGYSEQEALGHTPPQVAALLRDLQADSCVQESLRLQGNWHGEVWSRRRDGEAYPARVTLTLVQDARRSNSHLVAALADITPLKQAQARLDHQSHHDPLTGLPNRTLFENRLLRAVEDALLDGHAGGVLLLDLDRFKHINDSLGHPVGDELLRCIARRLHDALREQDTVARLGGDEFIILLPQVHGLSALGQGASRLMEVFAQPFHAAGHEFFITASMGVCLFPQNGSDVATLVKSADAAMYRAKARGRNRIEYYSDEMGLQASERVILENDLRRALAQDQLYLVFQPKRSLASGQIAGAEVLLRWRHPEYGDIAPERFIALAEDCGCIGELGSWVLERSCQQLAEWQAQYQPFGTLAVNLANAQLTEGDLVREVCGLLERYQLPAGSLELEITETCVMGQSGEVLPLLERLRALGVQLAIDDFGTGYSSLSHLKRLPVHTLKIDRAFIAGLPADGEDVAIVRAIIGLGRSMQLTLVAEGVETLAQEQFLVLEGCQQIQGYIVSRPLRAGDFAEQFLQRRQGLGVEESPPL